MLEEKGSTDAIHGNAEHILIVDDEPQLCNLAKSMLEHFGYTTACVSSGEEAITYLKNNDVDLVLLHQFSHPVRMLILDLDVCFWILTEKVFDAMTQVAQADGVDRCNADAAVNFLMKRPYFLLQGE